MKTALLLALPAMLLFLGAAPASQPAATESLAFLQGTWVSESGVTRTTETWTSAEGGLLLGTSKTVRGDKAVFFEFLRIETDASGNAVYVAMPRGKNETRFAQKGPVAEGKVVFENPQHDFPQRIVYTKKSDGTLVARIEGTVNGAERSKEWTFVKQP